jgi:hypothetical protein
MSGTRLNRRRWRKWNESATIALAFSVPLAFGEQQLPHLELPQSNLDRGGTKLSPELLS